MLAPLRRCVDGWPCMVGDLRGRKMRTGSKIENLSTTPYAESRELQLLLFNFLCNVNRAPYKCSTKIHTTSPGPPLYGFRDLQNDVYGDRIISFSGGGRPPEPPLQLGPLGPPP